MGSLRGTPSSDGQSPMFTVVTFPALPFKSKVSALPTSCPEDLIEEEGNCSNSWLKILAPGDKSVYRQAVSELRYHLGVQIPWDPRVLRNKKGS